jgi:predicted ATPase
MSDPTVIRTPDQRLRVFVSSTLGELAPERDAVRMAIERLRLVPVMFELGARPHPPRELYRAYLEQSQVLIGIYWQRYGWVAPGEEISGLEDEYRLGRALPGLFYLKEPAPEREPRLTRLIAAIKEEDRASYHRFSSVEELSELVQQDLAVLLTERFEAADRAAGAGTVTPRGRSSVSVARAAGGEVTTGVPEPLGSLVGRDADLAAVSEHLAGGARLVTLTGTGGVGKSRLALAVARSLESRYPDGVHLVPLGAIEEVDLVLPTLAASLGVGLMGTADASLALAAHLEGRRILLVLDNLEQVIAVAGDLVALLERCPGVQILATSRRPLQVVGEQEWRLQPLGLAATAAAPETIAESSAVELFVQRARSVDPTFTLHAGNASAVAELCRRLDGLPLAIELAAARVRLLPPAALLRRLGERVELLAGGPDRPERHRTLRATIAWSIRLLAPAERTVFARLSVFADGCTLDAAERVCDLEGRRDVTENVARLLDHGLLVVADDAPAEEPRVRMLETVRAEAAVLLEEHGETRTLRHRHLDWCAELADRAQPFLCGPDQLRWLERIDPERANLRAAARAGLELGAPATVLEMGWDLYVYYHLRAAHQEPEAWVAKAAADLRQLDARQRAIATAAAGISALWRGELTLARTRLEASLVTFTGQQLAFESAVAEMNLAACALAEEAWDEAATIAAVAAERFASIGHDWGVGSCEYVRGVATAAAGDRTGGGRSLERAADAGRRIDNPTLRARALTVLGDLAVDEGELELARSRLLEAVPLLVGAGDLAGLAGGLETLAALALAADEPAAASDALVAAGAVRERSGTPRAAIIETRVEALLAGIAAQDEELVAARRAAAGGTDPFEVLQAVAGTVSRSGVA